MEGTSFARFWFPHICHSDINIAHGLSQELSRSLRAPVCHNEMFYTAAGYACFISYIGHHTKSPDVHEVVLLGTWLC